MTIRADELDTCFMCGTVITYNTRVMHLRWHDTLNRRIYQHLNAWKEASEVAINALLEMEKKRIQSTIQEALQYMDVDK